MLRTILMIGMIGIGFFSTPSYAKNEGLELFAFRVGQISAFQSGGNVFSGVATWNPGLGITDSCGLRLNIGGTIFKSRVDKKFGVLEYSVLGALNVGDSLSLEAGAGFQHWFSNGGRMKMLQAHVIFPMKSRFLYLFDSLFGGYAMVFVPTKTTHEFRVGAGF